jgi:hypothetical protein
MLWVVNSTKVALGAAQRVQLRLFLHGDFTLDKVISSRIGIRTAFEYRP